jgi:hypothetical protein
MNSAYTHKMSFTHLHTHNTLNGFNITLYHEQSLLNYDAKDLNDFLLKNFLP